MIYVIGDTHGDINSLDCLHVDNFPQQHNLTKDDYVICLGDFGFIKSYYSEEAEEALQFLADQNYTFISVLGNHEDFNTIEKLQLVPFCDGYAYEVKCNNSSIYLLQKNSVYTIDDKRILVVGGACSPDRNSRIEGINWWKQEELTYKEQDDVLEIIKSDNKFDYLLTHTIASRYNRYFHKRHLIKCSVANFLDYIEDLIEYKEHHFGHFHNNDIFENHYCHFNSEPYLIGDKSVDCTS